MKGTSRSDVLFFLATRFCDNIIRRNGKGDKQMKFKMVHENYNVLDLERSLEFYEKALGFTEKRRKEADDGSFVIVYVGSDETDFELELTWLRDREAPYDLGDEEFHLAVKTPDYDKAHELHKTMGCICFENGEMGLYFIKDPDGYWIEIIPE